MWGAKLIQRRDLIEGLMRALVLAGQNQIGWQDQASLDTIVWPAAKYDVVRLIINSSCNNYLFKKSISFFILNIYLSRWLTMLINVRTST